MNMANRALTRLNNFFLKKKLLTPFLVYGKIWRRGENFLELVGWRAKLLRWRTFAILDGAWSLHCLVGVRWFRCRSELSSPSCEVPLLHLAIESPELKATSSCSLLHHRPPLGSISPKHFAAQIPTLLLLHRVEGGNSCCCFAGSSLRLHRGYRCQRRRCFHHHEAC